MLVTNSGPGQGYDTYYRPPHQQQFPIVPPNNFYLPQIPGSSAAPLTAFPHLGSDHQHNNNPWHPYVSLPQTSPRHLIASPQTPRIRVTGTAGRDIFAQPHPDSASFAGIYQLGRQPEASPLNLDTSFYLPDTQYYNNMATESAPNNATMQVPPGPVQIPSKHERTSSINSNSNMPTPVSLSGPRSPLLSPTSGEQPHMITSPQSHSRHISEDRSSFSGEDDRALRKNHSYKRDEEPPRNQDGKLTCKYQGCGGLFFERKCEWR